MKKSIVILIHCAYWLFFLISTFNSYIIPNSIPGKVIVALSIPHLLQGIIIFYIFYLLLIPKFLAKQKVRQFIFIGIAICALATVIALSLQLLLFQILPFLNVALTSPPEQGIVPYLGTYGVTIFISIVMALLNGVAATLIKGFVTWYGDIHLKELLAKQNLQTELALVKAQINPHFLFNTLNNIDILISRNPEVASSYLKKLSDIMRFMLYETKTEVIPLSAELAYIEKYIHLQKIRTTNENFVFIA